MDFFDYLGYAREIKAHGKVYLQIMPLLDGHFLAIEKTSMLPARKCF